MENMGENFANSSRREDKMRTEGGRDSFEKEKEEEQEAKQKSELSGYGRQRRQHISGEKILIHFPLDLL